jgi:hypothetical protein
MILPDKDTRMACEAPFPHPEETRRAASKDEGSLTKVTAALVATPHRSSHGEKGPASLRPYDASSLI